MNTRRQWSRWIRTVTILGCLLLWGSPAQAHKVTVFAWVEADILHTQSKFGGGKPVNGGKIEIFDQTGHKLLEGVTDGQGVFICPIPAALELKVVLTAGMGHSNQWVLTAEELGAVNQDRSPSTSAPGTPSAVVSSSTATAATPPQGVLPEPHLDADAVEQIVNRALDHKLAPIKAQLAAQSFGLRDIVAGFGYILGLMGLASYLRYRKKTG